MDSPELIHRTQLTNQSELPLVDSSSSKRSRMTSFHAKTWKSPIRYLLHSQRIVCLLIGIAMSAMFFNRFPLSSSHAPHHHLIETTSQVLPTRRVLFETARDYVVDDDDDSGRRGRVPLGLKRKKLRVLVTGGAGFVGSHLVDRLMDRGDSVIVVDNFFTGRKDNVVHHLGNPRFELIRHDVVEPILLEVDQIYHLACPASPVHYKFNPVKTIISFFLFPFSPAIIY